jgi:hypothetical protein
LTIAFFVEGKTDRDSITTVLAKLHYLGRLQASATYRILGSREAVLNVDKVCAQVRYEVLPQHGDLTGVVACADMNCHTSEELAEELKITQKGIRSAGLPIRVEYQFVRFAIESWLAADRSAWGRLFAHAGSNALPSNILDLCNPKEEIRNHLKARGQDFSHVQHDLRIVKELDVVVAERASSNFSEFVERVVRLSHSPQPSNR